MAPPTQPVGGAPPGGGGGIPKWALIAVPLVIIAVIAAVLVSSGGGDDDKKEDAGGGGGDKTVNIEDVKLATIRIVAQGSFVDPEIGAFEASGSGTGFILTSDGIAVTNNHVVTGAASLEVFVPGEDRPRNAKVLGVSECDDLAVIDIDGGGFKTVDWYKGEIKTGLDVFAIGYPLGDPEITQTRGIVSKARANGETIWASVDNAIEHDSKINPGNSGGPLVLSDGSVVGVNFAGAAEFDQNFAISADGAQEVVAQLRKGTTINSIGINGQAVFDEGAGISGVWVTNVDSGSPADKAGLQGGDILTRMENVTLAEDGTMSEYCDILRSHDAGDTLGIEVLRYATEEVLRGQVNGDELTQAFSFAQQEGGNLASGESYGDYQAITDDTGKLSVEVPTVWSDISGVPQDLGGGTMAPTIIAAPDINAFNNYDEPGALILLVEDIPDPGSGVDPGLDAGGEDFAADCTTNEGRQDFDDGLYIGKFDVYSGCGASGSIVYALAAYAEGGDFLIVVVVNAISSADLEALDHVLSTFLAL